MFQDNRSLVFQYTYPLMFDYPVYRRCTRYPDLFCFLFTLILPTCRRLLYREHSMTTQKLGTDLCVYVHVLPR
jgi:hypothetical protein